MDKISRVGFDAEGRPHPGVDKESGQRMAVTFAGLIKEFGVVEGIAKYEAIARLEMDMVHPETQMPYRARIFFDPAVERNYRPDLVIASLPPDVRAQVEKIISEPQARSDAEETLPAKLAQSGAQMTIESTTDSGGNE